VALGGDAIQALLAAPTRAKTAHFVLQAAAKPFAPELPTEAAPDRTDSVDNLSEPLGFALVVPKRHARRAVTRNLVRRQMREAMRRHLADWAGQRVLVRQRAAFDIRQYPSAASTALRVAVRDELERLFAQVAAR
jgi:ribonuclease P protein component